MVFYTTLFQKVSRKKTKNVPFLDGQAGSIFNKKWTFSENQGEKQKKRGRYISKKRAKNPLFFQKKRSVRRCFIENFSNRVEVSIYFSKNFQDKNKKQKKKSLWTPGRHLCKQCVSRGLKGLYKVKKRVNIEGPKQDTHTCSCRKKSVF